MFQTLSLAAAAEEGSDYSRDTVHLCTFGQNIS